MQQHSGDGSEGKKISHFGLVFFLNLLFTVVEFAGGVLTRSTAILADAVHDLGDSLSLGLSWWLERRSLRPGDRNFSFGYERFSLLGGVASAITLSMGSVFILMRAIPRLIHPEQADARGMVLLAVFGILVNGAGVLKMRKATGMNARMVTWHLAEDVLGWVAVLAAGIAMQIWFVPVLDPLLSLLITGFILFQVIRELRHALRVFLQGTPEGIDPDALERELLNLEGVSEIHHMHVWSLDGERKVVSLHVMTEKMMIPREIQALKSGIRLFLESMGMFHSTIEIEFPGESCHMGENDRTKCAPGSE